MGDSGWVHISGPPRSTAEIGLRREYGPGWWLAPSAAERTSETAAAQQTRRSPTSLSKSATIPVLFGGDWNRGGLGDPSSLPHGGLPGKEAVSLPTV